MKPYFETHGVGGLYVVLVLGWYLMEIIEFCQQRHWRPGAAAIGPRGYWAAFGGYVAAVVTMLLLAPRIAPGAAIGHGAVLFTVGIVMLVAGAGLRVWSFWVLGQYFTFSVKVSPDQPVVTTGPYRLLSHPGYAGGLLATTGIGVEYGNWVSLATVAVLTLAMIVWRIRIEERALLTTLNGRYRAYSAQHKRLVPLVW